MSLEGPVLGKLSHTSDRSRWYCIPHEMENFCLALAVLVEVSRGTPSPNFSMILDRFKTKYDRVYSGIKDSVRFENLKANGGIIRDPWQE